MGTDEQEVRSYRARIDPNHWVVIRDFVYDVVERSETHVPYKTKDLYNAVSEFTLWGWQSAALPLEISALFNRNVIAYYAQVGCGHLTAAARGNRRSLLLRVSEHLVRTGYRRLPPIPPSNPSEPYSQREVLSTISWARGQTTAPRRMNAHVLIALGLGAGLSAIGRDQCSAAVGKKASQRSSPSTRALVGASPVRRATCIEAV